MVRITLEPRRWYAAEFIGEEFGDDIRSYSPIRVDVVMPRGERRLSVIFYHANYPEGVREKVYDLQTLERNAQFTLARSLDHEPVRLILICEISATWLLKNMGVEVPRLKGVQEWLNENA